MRRPALLSLVAAAILVAAPAGAQEDPGYVVVQAIEVAPGDAETFAEQVAIVAAAAEEAEIGAEHAWNVYRWDNTFWFVGTEPSLANLEDPEAFVRAFEGKSSQGRAMAAFEKAGTLESISASMAVSQMLPELSYTPEEPGFGPDGPGGVMIVEQWVKGGQRGAWDESVREFMGFLADAGAPYPVLVTQDVIGDGGMSFVVVFDDLSSFFGENSMEALMEEHGTPELMEGAAAHSRLISREQSQILLHLPELSYQPGN